MGRKGLLLRYEKVVRGLSNDIIIIDIFRLSIRSFMIDIELELEEDLEEEVEEEEEEEEDFDIDKIIY